MNNVLSNLGIPEFVEHGVRHGVWWQFSTGTGCGKPQLVPLSNVENVPDDDRGETPNRRRGRRFLLRWSLVVAGLLLGAATAVVELVYAVLSAVVYLLVLPFSFVRSRVAELIGNGACRLSSVERWRLAAFLRSPVSRNDNQGRALRYLLARIPLGLIAGLVLLLVLLGVLGGTIQMFEIWFGRYAEAWKFWLTIYFAVFGAILFYLALTGLAGLAAGERFLARHYLGTSPQELLRRRVAELSTTRADVVEAVNDERRRIERDLHDGVQQRLVTLGMLIGRARRADDADKSSALLEQAHVQAQQALSELREVSWRVYPTALDAEGLHTALETVAERASVPVRLRYDLEDRPSAGVETAAYFLVSEAVTNAAKHSSASLVDVHIGRSDEGIVVRVNDDGVGGAVIDGAGLSGLARRVAALDGRFVVHSPEDGGTSITAELPCA